MNSVANSHTHTRRRVVIIILKTALWVVAIPVFLLLCIFIALQFPKTQQFAASKATAYLSSKIHSKVRLGELQLVFPTSVTLKDLYVEDQKKDTLLYSHFLKVNLNLWDLLSKKIMLQNIELDTFTGHISRTTANGAFNFSFIPEAFGSEKKDTLQTASGTTASAWQFNIKEATLKHIYFTYHDRSNGIHADVVLGDLETRFDAFDLTKKNIHVNVLGLKNTRAALVQNLPLAAADTSAAQPFDLDLAVKKITLDSVDASYRDNVNRHTLSATLGRFLVDVKTIDLKQERIELNTLALSGSEVYYTRLRQAQPDLTQLRQAQLNSTQPAKKDNVTETPSNWTLSLTNLDLENNTIGYNDDSKAPVKKAVDFSHLLAKHITLKGKNIYASTAKAKLDLEDFQFAEQSGFQLKKFQAKIVYDSTHFDLSGLKLQTNNSSINDHLAIRYHSLQELSDSIQNAELSFSLEKTTLAAKDLLYFAPEILKGTSLTIHQNTVIHLTGKLHGTLNDLTVSKFEVRTQQNTLFKITGSVRNLMHPKDLYASASFELNSTQKDLAAVVPDSLLPKTIEIPASFSITGNYKGYLKNFDAAVTLHSSFGAASASVTMNPKAGNVLQPYDGHMAIDNFDLGKLLKQPRTFGVVTLSAAVKGSGVDTSSINTAISLAIEKAVFKNYPYSHFTLDGVWNKKSFTGQAAMNDANLAFNFNGTVDMEPANPKYTFTLNLSGADLKALNLSKEDLRVSLLMQSDISAKQGENVSGRASIKNALVIRNNHRYPVDSLILTSATKAGVSDIHLTSEILTADFNGTITLNQLPEALTRHINTYFNLQQSAPGNAVLKKQDFKFELNLVDPSLLVGNLVPKLQKLTPFSIKGAYSSEAKIAGLDMNIPQIQYDSITVDSLRLNIGSTASQLDYKLRIAQVSNPTLKFENLFLGGELKNNSLSFRFNTAKDDSAKLLDIGGVLKSVNREFELKLDPELVINTQKWTIDNSNYIHFTKQGAYANNVTVSNAGQSVALNSKEKNPASPLEITFKDFNITTLSRLIENKKDLADGTINGNVIFEKQNGASEFRSDLVIKDLVFQAMPVGTIKLKADNFEDPSRYDVELSVEGSGNDLVMKGFYSAGKNSQLNFVLAVNHLNLSSAEPFTFGEVTRMSGSMNGQVTIKGDVASPQLNGDLNFKEAAFRPRFINSYLTIHDSKLSFDQRKLRFSGFTLNDSLKHKAVVDGSVDLNDMKKILLDLHIKTDDFLALNTSKKDNGLYYGTILIDSDIRVKGTANAPVIDARLKLNKGSAVTYVKPENEITKNESKGIVEFVNKHPEKNVDIMVRQNDSINGLSSTKGIDMHASIDFDKSVQIKVIVDPDSGDSLFIRGGGLLDFNLDPAGKMSLAGKYRINDGGYYLSLENVVKRNFKIDKGSTVSWSGDVLDPYVEMTAIYTLKASPLDLVSDELNGVDEMEKNKYRNLLTFNVYLKMTGFISSPLISFDIQLSPEDRGALNGAVNSQLGQLREDESQLNKQVFALLTLGRFVGENPLESSSDGGLSSASRASASKALTSELSSLTSKYVSFVDLDLGVNSFEDYSTGQEQGRTQVQVGVSKRLFKDKVTVRVGGNIDVEGERASQNDVNDVAGNVNVDYKLTPDGRYKLKGFRENQYENAIEGEITRTGAGVVYVRNFDTLKQLFKKTVKAKEPKEATDDDDTDDNK